MSSNDNSVSNRNLNDEQAGSSLHPDGYRSDEERWARVLGALSSPEATSTNTSQISNTTTASAQATPGVSRVVPRPCAGGGCADGADDEEQESQSDGSNSEAGSDPDFDLSKVEQSDESPDSQVGMRRGLPSKAMSKVNDQSKRQRKETSSEQSQGSLVCVSQVTDSLELLRKFQRSELIVASTKELCRFLTEIPVNERQLTSKCEKWGSLFGKKVFSAFQVTTRKFFILLTIQFMRLVNKKQQWTVREMTDLLTRMNLEVWGQHARLVAPMFEYILKVIYENTTNTSRSRPTELLQVRYFFQDQPAAVLRAVESAWIAKFPPKNVSKPKKPASRRAPRRSGADRLSGADDSDHEDDANDPVGSGDDWPPRGLENVQDKSAPAASTMTPVCGQSAAAPSSSGSSVVPDISAPRVMRLVKHGEFLDPDTVEYVNIIIPPSNVQNVWDVFRRANGNIEEETEKIWTMSNLSTPNEHGRYYCQAWGGYKLCVNNAQKQQRYIRICAGERPIDITERLQIIGPFIPGARDILSAEILYDKIQTEYSVLFDYLDAWIDAGRKNPPPVTIAGQCLLQGNAFNTVLDGESMFSMLNTSDEGGISPPTSTVLNPALDPLSPMARLLELAAATPRLHVQNVAVSQLPRLTLSDSSLGNTGEISSVSHCSLQSLSLGDASSVGTSRDASSSVDDLSLRPPMETMATSLRTLQTSPEHADRARAAAQMGASGGVINSGDGIVHGFESSFRVLQDRMQSEIQSFWSNVSSDLQKQINQQEAILKEKQNQVAELNEMQKKIKEEEATLKEKQKQVAELNEEVAELDRLCTGFQHVLDQFRAQSNIATADMTSVAKNIDTLSDFIDKQDQMLGTVATDFKRVVMNFQKLRADMMECKLQMEADAAEMRKLQSTYAELSREKARLDQSVPGLKHDEREIQGRIERMSGQIPNLQREISEKQTSIRNFDTQLQELEKLEGKIQRAEQLRSTILKDIESHKEVEANHRGRAKGAIEHFERVKADHTIKMEEFSAEIRAQQETIIAPFRREMEAIESAKKDWERDRHALNREKEEFVFEKNLVAQQLQELQTERQQLCTERQTIQEMKNRLENALGDLQTRANQLERSNEEAKAIQKANQASFAARVRALDQQHEARLALIVHRENFCKEQETRFHLFANEEISNLHGSALAIVNSEVQAAGAALITNGGGGVPAPLVIMRYDEVMTAERAAQMEAEEAQHQQQQLISSLSVLNEPDPSTPSGGPWGLQDSLLGNAAEPDALLGVAAEPTALLGVAAEPTASLDSAGDGGGE